MADIHRLNLNIAAEIEAFAKRYRKGIMKSSAAQAFVEMGDSLHDVYKGWREGGGPFGASSEIKIFLTVPSHSNNCS